MSALAVVCSSADPDSADEERMQEVQPPIQAFDELKPRLSDRLSVSSSAEHLHLAALLEDDAAVRLS